MPLTLLMPLPVTPNQTLKQNEALFFKPENSLLEYQYLMFCAHTGHAIDISVSPLHNYLMFFFYICISIINIPILQP